jgi:hypothetical protein
MSTRYKKLEQIAAEPCPYTDEELELLGKMIRDANIKSEEKRLANGGSILIAESSTEFDCSNIRDNAMELKQNVTVYRVIPEPRPVMPFMQYLLKQNLKAFIFLTCVGLKDMPLYITRGFYYNALAEWRLKINK